MINTFQGRQGLKYGYGLTPVLSDVTSEQVRRKLKVHTNNPLEYRLVQWVGCSWYQHPWNNSKIHKSNIFLLRLAVTGVGIMINVSKTNVLVQIHFQLHTWGSKRKKKLKDNYFYTENLVYLNLISKKYCTIPSI